jgi:hypothetical protein
MKKALPVFLSLFAIAVVTGAQEQERSKGKGKGDSGPLPLQGKNLPEVIAFDAAGQPFPLAQKLKGRHGVIVFGCLT